MKKFAIILTMLLTTLSLFAKEEEWELYEEGEIIITDDKLKLRDSQGTKAKVITVLPEKTFLQVLEEGEEEEIDNIDDYWVRVKALVQENGQDKTYEGWVFAGYTEPLDDLQTSGYKNTDYAVGFFSIDLDEKANSSPVKHTLYFINKKTLKLIKNISFIDGYYAEKRCFIYKGLVLDEARSLLYLGFYYSSDSENVQYIYRIDISKAEATDVVIHLGEMTGDKNFINKNIKLMLYNKTTKDGKRECNLTKPLPLYTKSSFDSKLNQSLPKDKKAVFIFDSSISNKSNIYLDEKKKGFWVRVDVYESDSPSSYVVFIE